MLAAAAAAEQRWRDRRAQASELGSERRRAAKRQNMNSRRRGVLRWWTFVFRSRGQGHTRLPLAPCRGRGEIIFFFSFLSKDRAIFSIIFIYFRELLLL
jgi:hypothetical protein